MGSFYGHVIPGGVISFLGLWWITQLPRRLLLCHQHGYAFFNTVTYPCPCCCCLHKVPVEGLVKIVGASVAMLLEFGASSGFGYHDIIKYMGDIQHMVMYGFFCLSGIIDCMTYRGLTCLPPNMDYVAMGLAFVAEAFIFSYHLDLENDGILEIILHHLLIFVVIACVFLTMLKCKFSNNLMAAFMLAYFVLLQGTWLIQIGSVLYPPVHHHYHNATMKMERKQWWYDRTPMLFTWHMAGDMVLACMLFLFCWYIYKKCCAELPYETEYQLAVHKPRAETNGRRQLAYRYTPVGKYRGSLDRVLQDYSGSDLTDQETVQ